MAIYWFGLGAVGFFAAVAIGFCAFAAMAVSIMLWVKEPADNRTVRRKPTVTSQAISMPRC
jgi:hypothetical protein